MELIYDIVCYSNICRLFVGNIFEGYALKLYVGAFFRLFVEIIVCSFYCKYILLFFPSLLAHFSDYVRI